ncbi:MAG: O-antigen ligase family protein [Bacteroidetes bacterium]|nr:O-antigen ligase family protein [Bacteroidota bacterium]
MAFTLFPEKIHRYIFLIGLCGLAWGMMMGAVPTSVPQLVLLGNFFAEGNFKTKWLRLKNNRVFWAASSVFWIYLIGLLWAGDLKAGWADVQIKIPLGWLPLILFSAEPLTKKEWQFALYCFLVGCFGNTVWCVLYSFVLHHAEAGRETSRFMSHIRLGLYLNMAIACCVYFFTQTKRIGLKLLFAALSIYFLAIMFVLGMASGIAVFCILFFVALCVLVYKQKLWVKISATIFLIVFIGAVANYILKIKNEQLSVKASENNTIQNGYVYLDTLGQKENGNLVWINLQMPELQREWKRKFPADSFNFLPNEHNINRFQVLVRYMTSKGLNKDSANMAQLSEKDFFNIQHNIPNYQYTQWNFLRKRVYELVNDYDAFVHRRWVNGHSFTMRIYFWQAAVHVIKKDFLFGVGTGNLQQSLNAAYDDIHSPLNQDWRKRPHNQFLSVTVSLGIFGLLIFIFGIAYPAFILRKQVPKLFWAFLLIALLSFFPEDTLDTQAGVTFYAFFNTLFLSIGFFSRNKQFNPHLPPQPTR